MVRADYFEQISPDTGRENALKLVGGDRSIDVDIQVEVNLSSVVGPHIMQNLIEFHK